MQKLNLWDPARAALDKTIKAVAAQDPDNEFVVVPFQGQTYPAVTFTSKEYPKAKKEIDKAFDNYITRLTNTNIFDVFQTGMKYCDPNKENRVYLITDGVDNINGSEKVCQLINQWCVNHANTRFFYVTLDGVATDENIDRALANCSDAYKVETTNGQIPILSDMTDDAIYASTMELDREHEVTNSLKGPVPLIVECSDPYFSVEAVGGNLVDHTARFRFKNRKGLPLNQLNDSLEPQTDGKGYYTFTFTARSSDPTINIVNPELVVKMANIRQRTLSILGGEREETEVKPASTSYPAFLWSKEKLPDTLKIDLAPIFNDACTASSVAYVSAEPANEEPRDFDVFFNGNPVGADEGFALHPGQPAELEIVFHPDSKTGKRYLTLVNEGADDLHLINNQPADTAELPTLRLKYERNWNPLATFLLWLGIVLLSALILWFLFLRRVFFPGFKVSRLQFEGPDTFFVSKRIKGARMVLLTSSRKEQSLISRIFKGRVVYIRDDFFTPEIEITPAKRTARMRPGNRWDVTPSARLEKGQTYVLTNIDSRKQSKITVE